MRVSNSHLEQALAVAKMLLWGFGSVRSKLSPWLHKTDDTSRLVRALVEVPFRHLTQDVEEDADDENCKLLYATIPTNRNPEPLNL